MLDAYTQKFEELLSPHFTSNILLETVKYDYPLTVKLIPYETTASFFIVRSIINGDDCSYINTFITNNLLLLIQNIIYIIIWKMYFI